LFEVLIINQEDANKNPKELFEIFNKEKRKLKGMLLKKFVKINSRNVKMSFIENGSLYNRDSKAQNLEKPIVNEKLTSRKFILSEIEEKLVKESPIKDPQRNANPENIITQDDEIDLKIESNKEYILKVILRSFFKNFCEIENNSEEEEIIVLKAGKSENIFQKEQVQF